MKVYDLDGVEHEKEPVDVRECISILGWTAEPVEKQEKPAKKQKSKVAEAPQEQKQEEPEEIQEQAE